jgi:hypothetical protein
MLKDPMNTAQQYDMGLTQNCQLGIAEKRELVRKKPPQPKASAASI